MVVTTDAAVPDGVVEEIVASEGFVDGWCRRLLLSLRGDGCAPQRSATSRSSRVDVHAGVVITKHGGPGVLQVQERPDPTLGAGEVRIEVAAAGINFADVMARMGLYPDAPKTPCVVGYEVAGTILEVGEGVGASFSHGQRVFASTQFGGYASQVVVPAADVVALPERSASSRARRSPSTTGPPGRA